MKVLLWERTSIGGAKAYTHHLGKALSYVGVECIRGSKPESLFEDCDAVVITSIGNKGPKDGSRNKELLTECIRTLAETKPIILVRHDVTELDYLSDGYETVKDVNMSGIVYIEDTDSMKSHVEENHSAERIVFIDHPYDFRGEGPKNLSSVSDTILSCTRIDSKKRTSDILDIAGHLIGKKTFLIAGKESGVYWYWCLKAHKHYSDVGWIGCGERDRDTEELFSLGAYNIDLTFYISKKEDRKAQCRSQYTTYEAVEQGAIPVMFDVWRYGGSPESVWLPSPEKFGRKYVVNAEACADIIEYHEYSYDVAVENFRRMKLIHGLDTIGSEWKSFLKDIVGHD